MRIKTMFVEGDYIKSAADSPGYELKTVPNEVIDSNKSDQNEDSVKVWKESIGSPLSSSPLSSSGYQSSQTSGDEAIDGIIEDKTQCNDQKSSQTESQTKMDFSDWDYEDFDPQNPYLNEPLTYPPDQELHLPLELLLMSCTLWQRWKSQPKRISRKRVSRSPEIKPKISRRTGRPFRSSQFLLPDEDSEGSDSGQL